MDSKVQSCLICIGASVTIQAGVSLGHIYEDKSASTGYHCNKKLFYGFTLYTYSTCYLKLWKYKVTRFILKRV